MVFQENFDDTAYLQTWNNTSKIEQALWLGKDNSNYLRFHPRFQNQYIETPGISLPPGNYTLYFEWNKARIQTPDSVHVQLSVNNGNTWQTLYSIYDGSNRTWQKDSILLDSIDSTLKIRWNYFSSGSFPAQYFNLDNVSIAKNISTGIKNDTSTPVFSIFPNPSEDYVQIRLKNPMLKKGILTIYNTSGERVYQKDLQSVLQTLLQIDVSNYSKGAYIVTMQLGEEQFSKTILVQ